MLSPASHRVCCLAVMAPALTKAVRQADCLPFVLSKAYRICGKGHSYTFNHDSAVSNDVRSRSVNNSMPDDRTWCQTPLQCEFLLKSPDLVSQDSPVLLSSRDQTNAELEAEAWHGTKIAEAISAKIRHKTTMNENRSSTLKNMGLAKANTSLGFQSPKKNQTIMPVSHPSTLTPKMQRILQLPEKPLAISDSPTVSPSYNSSPSLGTTVIGDTVVASSKVDGIDMSLPLVAATACNKANETPSTASETSPGASKNNAHISVSVSTIVALPSILSNDDSTIPNSTSVATMESDSYLSSSENSESTLSANPFMSPSSESSQDSQNLSLMIDVDSPPAYVHSPSHARVFEEPPPSDDTLRLSLQVPRKVLMRYRKGSADIISTLASKPNSKVEVISSFAKLQTELAQHSQTLRKLLDSIKTNHIQVDQRCKSVQTQALELQLKHLNHYVRQQLQGFVAHYQKKLGIPCQKQVRPNLNRRSKETVDLKTELLQSENVRNLSTAALVNLVRKMESSPEKYLAQQTYSSISSNFNSSDNIQIEPVEWEELKRTSNSLAHDVHHLLAAVDSDATDASSEEESCEESDASIAEEPKVESGTRKKALWKWVNERAAIASRWTWLIAQVHDLEYHLRRLDEVTNQLRLAKGGVCFEELGVPSESSALSTTYDADNACLQTTPTKQTSLKSIIKPVNGYLDHSGTASIADESCVTQSISSVPAATDQQESGQDEAESSFCCRTRPFKASSFHKRKLFHAEGLYQTSTKASRLSTVACSCNCQSMMQPCILCGGRYNNVQSVDPDSMPLLERIALLDPTFHPVLSLKKDVPLQLHFENALKMKEPYYQSLNVQPQVVKKPRFGTKSSSFSNIRNHNRKLKCFAGSLLSAKYRKKHVRNSSGHLRKRGLIFGKWRRLQNKSSLRRVRRFSIASSTSSRDSPIPSPSSMLEDSYGYDQWKRRRDDFQFDIDDVIIPCNSKVGRVEKLTYKDIEIPSWRYKDLATTEPTKEDANDTEDISDLLYKERSERLEVEEQKILRGLNTSLSGRRGRRHHRCDSRADSSGANTPDPVLMYHQDIMFQDPSGSSAFHDPPSTASAGSASPALSPPATPCSATAISDDSQPPFGIAYRKRSLLKVRERSCEDAQVTEHVEVPPYEHRVYPLSDREYDEMLKASTHLNDDPDQNGLSCPVSPASSTESTSTVEEEDDDDDITDPEWTVVKRDNGPEQALVLKFAKR